MFLSQAGVRFWLSFAFGSSAALYGLSCQAGVPDSAQSKAFPPPPSRGRVSGTSGPAVGVALLENIFSRFSNVPQIAMAQAGSLAAPKKNVAPNSVDYSLAIRPKDSGKGWMAPSPSLHIIAQRSDTLSSKSFPGQSRATEDANAGAGASFSGIALEEGARPAPQPQLAYDAQPETWRGSKLARGQSNSVELRQLSKSENDRLGFWEKEREASPKAQEYSENTVKGKLQARDKVAMDDVESSARRKKDVGEMKSMMDSRLMAANTPPVSEPIVLSDRKREVIALLPPNVVSGIPLVSLGASKAQVVSAFAGLGTISEEKINGWNVLSLYRKAEGKSPALQLFFRHGLLDAIRIFDKSLIAPDFGVSPGDNLAAVKQKFGEPAFLVQEPHPGLGQNYIYPISQAGFQLARTDPSSVPTVISVLIFSVK